MKKMSLWAGAAGVLVFLFVLLSSPFLHVETSLRDRTPCPACQFQSTALADGGISPIFLPALTPLGQTHDPVVGVVEPATLSRAISRAPPIG
jgi:hypothetical protein